jgi:predicted nuclease of predicted toxin-antitoxin system
LRLLVDANVHRLVIAGLRNDGHDTAAVAELRPEANDDEIIAWANEERRVLITSDRDFGKLLIAQGASAPAGVLYLRLPRLALDATLDRLRELLGSGQPIEGHLIVVAPAGERWRSLGS